MPTLMGTWHVPHETVIVLYGDIIKKEMAHIAKFMGPTWGPSGTCRPQMGPILAPWTLLSGIYVHQHEVNTKGVRRYTVACPRGTWWPFKEPVYAAISIVHYFPQKCAQHTRCFLMLATHNQPMVNPFDRVKHNIRSLSLALGHDYFTVHVK